LFRALHTFREQVGSQTNLLHIGLAPRPSGILFSDRFEFGRTPLEWSSDLYVLNWMLKAARLATPDWSPAHICVRSAWDRSREKVLRELGASTFEFGARHSGFVVPWGLLSLPLRVEGAPPPGGSGEGESRLRVPAMTLRESLLQAIEAYSGSGWLSAGEAAELGSASVRSLQRHLANDGTSFSEVLEEARFNKATRWLLGTDATVGQIGQELGYSDQANFSRAFRTWAGVSPGRYRKQRST